MTSWWIFFTAESDLQNHNDIENFILIPLASELEAKA